MGLDGEVLEEVLVVEEEVVVTALVVMTWVATLLLCPHMSTATNSRVWLVPVALDDRIIEECCVLTEGVSSN